MFYVLGILFVIIVIWFLYNYRKKAFNIERCNTCGTPVSNGVKCCEFSDAEESFKENIKNKYYELAGRNASKVGLANYIWRQFINVSESEKKAIERERQSREEKHAVISRVGAQYDMKYKSIIAEKDKEILYLKKLTDKLRNMYLNQEIEKSQGIYPAPEIQIKTGSNMACNGCGSKTTCYCK